MLVTIFWYAPERVTNVVLQECINIFLGNYIQVSHKVSNC